MKLVNKLFVLIFFSLSVIGCNPEELPDSQEAKVLDVYSDSGDEGEEMEDRGEE